MSGGHYEYRDRALCSIADHIREDIREFRGDSESGIPSARVLNRLKEGLDMTLMTQVFLQRIDYLISGDDGDKTFQLRLRKELEALPMASKNGEKIIALLLGREYEEPKKRTAFTPPTRDEIVKYLEGIVDNLEDMIDAGYLPAGYYFDVSQFMAYYEARGWCFNGGKKMKNWKACIQTWIANDRRRHVGG